MLNKHPDIYKTVLEKYHDKREGLRDALLDKVKDGTLQSADVETVLAIEAACWDAILVDEFDFKEVAAKRYESLI